MSFLLPEDDLDLTAPQTSTPSTALPPIAGVVVSAPKTLLISSQSAAHDGTYQAFVESFKEYSPLEKQMIDRIVDGAIVLPTAHYEQIALLLPAVLLTPSLLALLEPALAPGASLQVHGPAAEDTTILSELTLAGLVGGNMNGQVLTATKPKITSVPLSFKKRPASSMDTTPIPSSTTASALPLRTSRAAKASLWAFTSTPSTSGTTTPTIDESTLLTAADLERPTLVKREDCDVKRTRKACKNCSCGLRELLLDEKENEDELRKAGLGNGSTAAATNGAANGAKKIGSGAMTSSCGSCYLGDAFRCASCPFLGMPAFEPGEKVKIDSSMDDI